MKKYIVFFLTSLSLYIIHFSYTRHGIYGDGNGYFALAHTIFFQPKLDFQPVYQYLSHFQGRSYIFSRIFWDIKPTATGVLNCPWIIGTAFFWMFPFFVIHTLSLVPGIHISNFSYLYEFGCGVTGIILMMAGLFFIEKMLQNDFDKKSVIAVIITLYFGTLVFYYSSFEPALAHQASFFLVSLILYIIRSDKRETKYFIALGFSIGLLTITRMGEIVLIAIPTAIFILHHLRKRNAGMLVRLAAPFIIGVLPQLLLQKAMYGNYFYNPYLRSEKGVFHTIFLSSLWNQLWALRGGFLLWSPIFICAVAGLILVYKKQRLSVLASGLSLLIYYIVISSWEFIPPAGFGNRFFLSTIPLLSVGLAYFFKQYRQTTIYLIILSVCWNMFLVGYFFSMAKQ